MNHELSSSLVDEVHVVVPPYSVYLRSLRLLAADACGRAGLDCNETDDFRIAVDELSSTLMTATDHPVFVSFASARGVVVARGAARRRDGAPACAMSELSSSIVSAVADTYSLDEDAETIGFTVAREHAAVIR